MEYNCTHNIYRITGNLMAAPPYKPQLTCMSIRGHNTRKSTPGSAVGLLHVERSEENTNPRVRVNPNPNPNPTLTQTLNNWS